MKQKKGFKYYLKKDVRDDLDSLYVRLSCLLHHDDEGFGEGYLKRSFYLYDLSVPGSFEFYGFNSRFFL